MQESAEATDMEGAIIPLQSGRLKDPVLAQFSIDAVADMIIWLDQDGRYVFVNKATTQLLGYSSEELTTRTVCDMDPDVDAARWSAHWDELGRLGSVMLETTNRAKDGTVIPVEVRATMVTYRGVKYNCAIVRDITERRRAEAERRALTERIRQMSMTDGLTGVANRRCFDERLAAYVEEADAMGRPLSLIMLDVDHFKSFNDRYGHLAGDDCLRRVAGAVEDTLRPAGGLAARYGGEEFACILPGVDGVEALRWAQRVRGALHALAIPHEGAPAGYVTASMGLASARPSFPLKTPGPWTVALVAAADACLYRAKSEGRDRIVAGGGR
ncbi:GGDEF domain-containing protein [Rhizobium rhizosphaerae]|nr:GGDEF domain-containing protein [Xaviernesmea rhizosphaerae]